MSQHVSVLLVYDESTPMDYLKAALGGLSLSAGRARTCLEARHLIRATEPHLIFTDARLPDGTWAEVVRHAETAKVPSSVIVVSGTEDIPFYIKAMEQGAFDFLMPPFESRDLDHIVRCALSNAMARRSEHLLAHSAA